MSITPKNWKSFQHYKDRAPAWIKLHKGLLDDFGFSRLPLASRALAPMLWLLASEYEGGEITASTEEIAFRLHVTEAELVSALTPLIDAGFFLASGALAEPEHVASLEKEREEEIESCPVAKATRTKLEYSAEFEAAFWTPYPRSQNMSKKEAWREWGKLDPGDREAACKAIEPYKKLLRSKQNLEPVHACRFLSQRRFEGFFEAPSLPAQADIRSHLA